MLRKIILTAAQAIGSVGIFSAGLTAASSCLAQPPSGPEWLLETRYERVSGFMDGHVLTAPHQPLRHPHSSGGSHYTGRIDATRTVSGTDQLGGWSWGLFVHQDVWLNANRDAVSTYAVVNEPALQDQHWMVWPTIKYLALRRMGVTVGAWMPVPAWGEMRLGAAVRSFAADQGEEWRATGNLQSSPNQEPALSATVDRWKLGGRSDFVTSKHPLGWGLSLDLAAIYGQPQEGTYAALQTNDLLSRVWLKHTLRTHQELNSATRSTDAQGFDQYKAAIQGEYTLTARTLRIPRSWRAEGHLPVQALGDLLGQISQTDAVREWAAGWRFPAGWASLRPSVWLHSGPDLPPSLQLELRSKQLAVSWRADQFNPKAARVWSLSAAWHW